MSIIDTLITDRAQTDLETARALAAIRWDDMTIAQKTAWAGVLKAYYDYTDCTRVEAAVDYIAARLAENDYAVTLAAAQTWSNGDEPTAAQWDAYLARVAVIRAALPALDSTPAVPADWEAPTLGKANDIEQILVDTDAAVSRMEASWYYAAEISAGEV